MPTSAPLTFGILLKTLRKTAGMTQRDLAAALGYSDSQISGLEKGQRTPDLDAVMLRFVPALGLQDDPTTIVRLVEQAAARGIVLDVGHGGASFSFEVAEAAIRSGLLPHTISTDLHQWSLDGAVWDLATTLSKLLALGMPFEAVVRAATTAPRAAIRKPTDGFLTKGARADFTLFDLVDQRLDVRDSKGRPARLERLFEPRRAIIGASAIEAHRHLPPDGPKGRAACPNCGWLQ